MKFVVRSAVVALWLGAGMGVAYASGIGQMAQVSVVDRQSGQSLPIYQHGGEYWVAGQPGAKYAIRIRNSRGSRVLAVTSVDGLNVLSGDTANFGQNGYVFDSRQSYDIEGWRKSDWQVAAFVFTASPDSYAERVGKPRDVGVIGVALFREQPVVQEIAPVPSGWPPSAKKERDILGRSDSAAPPSLASSAAAAAAPLPPAAPAAAERAAADGMHKPSAQARAPSAALAPAPQAKLGTGHGERETSFVNNTHFSRKSSTPDEVIRIRYDSHANLVAMGVIPSPRSWYGQAPNAFPGQPVSYVPDPPNYR